MKGISREVVPYAVEGLLGEFAQRPQVISEHATGLDLFIDLEALDDKGLERAQKRLKEAFIAVTKRAQASAPSPSEPSYGSRRAAGGNGKPRAGSAGTRLAARAPLR